MAVLSGAINDGAHLHRSRDPTAAEAFYIDAFCAGLADLKVSHTLLLRRRAKRLGALLKYTSGQGDGSTLGLRQAYGRAPPARPAASPLFGVW